MANVILINSKDNVGIVIDEIKKGDDLLYKDSNGNDVELKALDDIRIYHKVAITEIKKGEHIIKYGEHIGVAKNDIVIGQHVHTHNVEDRREDLSLVE